MIRTTKISRRWTDEDAAALRRMYQAGATNDEIAETLCRSLPSVMQKISVLRRRTRLFSD